MICSCSDETPCHIGHGGDSTSHGVCRLIDNCGIDGDSISRGVGGLVDNATTKASDAEKKERKKEEARRKKEQEEQARHEALQ
jgi:hypothetical protein